MPEFIQFVGRNIRIALVVVIGGMMAAYGLLSDAYQLFTLGLPGGLWAAIGAVIIVVVLFHWDKRLPEAGSSQTLRDLRIGLEKLEVNQIAELREELSSVSAQQRKFNALLRERKIQEHMKEFELLIANANQAHSHLIEALKNHTGPLVDEEYGPSRILAKRSQSWGFELERMEQFAKMIGARIPSLKSFEKYRDNPHVAAPNEPPDISDEMKGEFRRTHATHQSFLTGKDALKRWLDAELSRARNIMEGKEQ